MRNKTFRHILALEEEATGKTVKEIEHVIYGHIVDFDDFKRASSYEHQEQWEIRVSKTENNAAKGSIRIRRTQKGDALPEFVITTKTVANSHGDKYETAVPSSEQNFIQFKMLAETGMKKTRYFFPVKDSDLVWEVDVFEVGQENGERVYNRWCKIDLEVTDRNAPLPPLPIELTDVISAPFGERTEAEEKRVSELYSNVFRIKNQHSLRTS